MGETREEFINGFCRTTNESRTVCCEYEGSRMVNGH